MVDVGSNRKTKPATAIMPMMNVAPAKLIAWAISEVDNPQTLQNRYRTGPPLSSGKPRLWLSA